MDKVKLKPKDGLLVRHPISYAPLAPEGELVEFSPFWSRRLADGSVTIIADEPTPELNAPGLPDLGAADEPAPKTHSKKSTPKE